MHVGNQFVALERNAEKGIPGHMEEAYRAYREGRLAEFYAPLVVSDDELARGLANGSLAVDTRLRDALRSLRFGEGESVGTPIAFETPGVAETAAFAGESSALQESDLGLALGDRVDALERRLSALERRPWSRVRARVGPWRA